MNERATAFETCLIADSALSEHRGGLVVLTRWLSVPLLPSDGELRATAYAGHPVKRGGIAYGSACVSGFFPQTGKGGCDCAKSIASAECECGVPIRERRMTLGFTLIELLVVISIIAIVSAMVGVAVRSVKNGGLRTKSMANMRTIGTAMIAYSGDNNGDFPRSAHSAEEESWIYSLSPYLSNLDEIRVCPADPQAKERLKAKKTTSYTLNEYICVPSLDRFGRVKEDFTNRFRLPVPSRTMAVFIGADGLDVGVSNDHTHSRNWNRWTSVLTDVQPDRFRSGEPSADRSEGESHYLFVDGHVETHPAKWLKDQIDSQQNPAIPPK